MSHIGARKSLYEKPHNTNRIIEMRNGFQFGQQRVVARNVQGGTQGSLWKSNLKFKNPKGTACPARLDYAPMSSFLNTHYEFA